jgi:serine/threonine protein kinase
MPAAGADPGGDGIPSTDGDPTLMSDTLDLLRTAENASAGSLGSGAEDDLDLDTYVEALPDHVRARTPRRESAVAPRSPRATEPRVPAMPPLGPLPSFDGPDGSGSLGAVDLPTEPRFLAADRAPTPRLPEREGGAPAKARAPVAMVAGRYRLLSLIGEGGMGAVYEAEHVELGKHVAIKLLNVTSAAMGPRDEVVQRFKHEARSVSLLEDDHIVQVFDAGEDPTHGLFMVMELLRGEDLEQVLMARGRLAVRFACGLVHQVCIGLERAHARRLIHRDLKPANIFLARTHGEGVRAKIVDFGLAKLLRDVSGGGRGALTRAGVTLGTPQYMSPEQALALDVIDERTDVYSLGAVLFEALAGEAVVPSYNQYERTIVHITSTTAPRVSDLVGGIPPRLDDLVAAMLAPLGQRIASARAVRERLAEVFPDLDGERLSLPPVGIASGSQALRPPRAWPPAASPVRRSALEAAATAPTVALQHARDPNSPAPFVSPVSPASPRAANADQARRGTGAARAIAVGARRHRRDPPLARAGRCGRARRVVLSLAMRMRMPFAAHSVDCQS